jgi:hypothetical protein
MPASQPPQPQPQQLLHQAAHTLLAEVPLAEPQGSWSAGLEQQEEADLAAAIEASMASASASAADGVALPGMRNEAGEYNCFINVIIQCLWRCAEFRQQVAGWDADFRAADPVLHAVYHLFQQFEAQEAARRAGRSLVAVDPTPLRRGAGGAAGPQLPRGRDERRGRGAAVHLREGD